MKNFVEYLLVRLVDHPEDLVVEEEQTDEGLAIHIRVHADDMGRVIGRSGNVIKAIRKLVQVKAAKDDLQVRVLLDE
ncbi:MAG: KH domain-containing protein [Candidatus Paceibacterota bacterium]